MNQKIKTIFLSFTFVIVVCLYACSKSGKQNTQDEWDKNNTREIFADNPDLVRSKKLTKEKLPSFISEFNKDRGDGFYVKLKLTESGKYEHIWLRILSIDGENSSGVIDNEPTYFNEIKYGDTVNVNINEAEDIMIYKNDSLILGGYLQKLSKK